MSGKQEMLTDIVNEIRARAGAWPDEKLKQYDLRLADHIEEAANRKLNENSRTAQIEFCNVAKLRKMVVEIRRIIVERQRVTGTGFSSDDTGIDIVNAILATPPRNCDRYTGEDINRDVADACTRADNDLMLDYDCEELSIRWLLSTTAQVDEYLKHKDDEQEKMWRAIYDRRQQEATE